MINKLILMISVCIPVYNFNVTKLLTELSRQSAELSVDCEIVVIDDASDDYYKLLNEEICKKQTYIKLERNIGRAAIRNLFLKYTQFNYLLFIDCDSVITSPQYLSDYIKEINTIKPEIICGGRVYDTAPPDRNHLLRWKYGIRKESQPLAVRLLSPNKSFMTNNFLINRILFEKIQFDERLKDYGHEDTLFGYLLKKQGVSIYHIDNPVLNGDIETNIEYLEKTEKGINNLAYVLQYVDYEDDFIEDVSLLKYYFRLKKMHIILPVKLLSALFSKSVKYLLTNGYANLYLFDFYKLGVLVNRETLR